LLVVIFGGVFWDLIAGGDELRVWARPGEGRLFILHESTVKATCNIPCDLLVVIRRRGLINCAFALRFHFALFTLRFCQQVRSALLRFFFFKPQTSYKVHLYKYGSEAHFCAFSVLNHKQATKYIYTSMGPKRTFALFLF